MKKWLKHNFEPHTHEKAEGRTRLLIFDGHGSHTTPDVLRHCILNNIQVTLLPAHSSHLTQPLDIGVFSSMKAHMTRELDRYIRTQIPRIQKAEWLDAFIKARPLAFTHSHIFSGWSGTGLFPFNPQKVLSRILLLAPIEPPSHESTPEFQSPFLHPDLTSSPIESLAMAMANAAIQQYATDRFAIFDTPAHAHVDHLV